MPSSGSRWPEEVWQLCEQACDRIAKLCESYPFLPLPTVAATTVTRSRPLPVEQLRQQIEHHVTGPGSVTVLTA